MAVASNRFQRSGQAARNRNNKKEKKEKVGSRNNDRINKNSIHLANNFFLGLIKSKRKWEEDKVGKLKASSRFKPY